MLSVTTQVDGAKINTLFNLTYLRSPIYGMHDWLRHGRNKSRRLLNRPHIGQNNHS